MPHVNGRASPNAHLLVGELPVQRQLAGRWREGTGLSIAAHTAVLVVFLYAGAHAPQMLATVTPMIGWSPEFLGRPGAGARGSGEGNGTSEPVRRTQPAETRPRHIAAAANPADAITPPINVPVVTAQAVQTLPGALTDLDATSPARYGGPGGEGSGSGPGRARGPGDGGPGATGSGVFEAGNGVTAPELILEVKPSYTVDAMRAKLQGAVELEAGVLPDGSVDPRRIRITRSLDRALGLDDQAIVAVRQWRFRPGMLRGRPVPVRVTIELTFTLR